MTTASQQKKAIAKTKAETAKAEAFIADAKAKTNGKRKAKEWPCTAEQIISERDHKGQSWKQVAINLDLGSPGAARKAYTELTGVPHYESQAIVKRTRNVGTGKKKDTPGWDDDTDQGEIEASLNGSWVEESGSGKTYIPAHWSGSLITVQRQVGESAYEEEVLVRYCTAFSFGPNGDQPLQVSLIQDNGAARTFFVTNIISVRS